MKNIMGWMFVTFFTVFGLSSPVLAKDGVKAAYEDGGMYYTKNDIPTYKIQKDGTVDWSTFSGYRRYLGNCYMCHGPDGGGSSFAPALKNSVLALGYYKFVNVVTNGRNNVTVSSDNLMPSFGNDPNVMCYLDDIYVYLKARGMDAIPRGRPLKHAPEPKEAREAEKDCIGG